MSDNFIEKFDDLVFEQYYENKNTIRDCFERTSMNEYVALKEISKHQYYRSKNWKQFDQRYRINL